MAEKAEKEKEKTPERKVFNDPIHGHMDLHPLLVKIIDTPQFQRLRNIRQMGGAYFVYPGASHNRFEHSIGVGYLAGELAKTLQRKQPELSITDTDILCVQIAGLCHDMGHGPFSHLYDQKFIAKTHPDEKWEHETASVKMFDHMVEKNDLKLKKYNLKYKELKFIKSLIKGHQPSEQAESKDKSNPNPGTDKSFLYEIVANKRNGIDVDKFDYLARDCYHLGLQNSFDYSRFLKFTMVCDVGKEKHLCTREKEMGNLYEMFHVRYGLHRRACQHRVSQGIEMMITDAFLKADKDIKIEGSGEREFSLSAAKDDMVAYTKLTDDVFEKILNSSETSESLSDAKEILERIQTRKLYKSVGEILRDEMPSTDHMRSDWETGLVSEGLKKEDFEVVDCTLDYGMKDEDPLKDMYYYKKEAPGIGYKISEQKIPILPLKSFSKKLVRVFCKSPDKKIQKKGEKLFKKLFETED